MIIQNCFSVPINYCKGKGALCRICQEEILYSADSKGNLRKHYRAKHEKKLMEEERRSESLNERATLAGQSIIRFSPKGGLSCEVQPFAKQKSIEESIARHLCAIGSLPLTITERPFFRQFMNETQPRFTQITYRTVMKHISKFANDVDSKLKRLFSETNARPTVTLDGWTAQNGNSYLGSTCHFIERNELSCMVLFLVELRPPHTANLIRARFLEQIEEYNVKPFRVITDNAANMKAAFSEELYA